MQLSKVFCCAETVTISFTRIIDPNQTPENHLYTKTRPSTTLHSIEVEERQFLLTTAKPRPVHQITGEEACVAPPEALLHFGGHLGG